MRNIFIINPKAGKGSGLDRLADTIRSTAQERNVPVELYRTRAAGDAEEYVRSICRGEEDEPLRFFACGGDGTFNEVLNGACGCARAEIGVVPIGTGNDFARNFPQAGDFLDIGAQLSGRTEECDAIRYSGEIDGRPQTRWCANMFNIGFDCNVVDMTARLKQVPLVAGSLAYVLAVLVILIRKKGANLKIELDGESCFDGPLLLSSLANGKFCGGGMKSPPAARTDDGRMDINIIRDVPRRKFLRLFPSYTKGTYLQRKGIEQIVTAKTGVRAAVTPKEGAMRLCTDGEITTAGRIEFELVHDAFRFLVPCPAAEQTP